MTTDREERYQKISQILENDLSEKEGLFIGKFSEELEVHFVRPLTGLLQTAYPDLHEKVVEVENYIDSCFPVERIFKILGGAIVFLFFLNQELLGSWLADQLKPICGFWCGSGALCFLLFVLLMLREFFTDRGFKVKKKELKDCISQKNLSLWLFRQLIENEPALPYCQNKTSHDSDFW